MSDPYQITLIGAGNVATHLGKALQQAGYTIRQVYSRSETSARTLSETLQTSFTCNTDLIDDRSDLYLFALKDDALLSVLEGMKIRNKLFVHTAGSIDFRIFDRFTSRYGVMYPLQTFSKKRVISLKEIPLFVESSDPETRQALLNIARSLSERVEEMSSEKRKFLHLAAVFACNFTNHIYSIASSILEEQNLEWDYLRPLIRETVEKVNEMYPNDAQTGPAVRFDKNIISNQLDLLTDKYQKELYRLISENIHRMATSSSIH